MVIQHCLQHRLPHRQHTNCKAVAAISACSLYVASLWLMVAEPAKQAIDVSAWICCQHEKQIQHWAGSIRAVEQGK